MDMRADALVLPDVRELIVERALGLQIFGRGICPRNRGGNRR